MQNQLTVFNFQDREVQTVTIANEPWFFAKDVAEILDLGNMHSSLAKLDDDEKGLHTVETPSGFQEVSIINEPGLYSLILRSRKKEAKAFKRWVTHEVLPAIRKTGAYAVQQYDPMAAMAIQTNNINQLTAVLTRAIPSLNNEVIMVKQEQVELTNRLSAVEQHQRDHDAKMMDAYRQGLHRCKELLKFGTAGKPQPVTFPGFWRELKEHCKVSSFDMRNQAALSVPLMKKAFERAQSWCESRGVNPPSLFDFIEPEQDERKAS